MRTHTPRSPATFVRPPADPVFADKPLTETLGSVSDAQLVSELGMWRKCRCGGTVVPVRR
jgi:hypothetical protein